MHGGGPRLMQFVGLARHSSSILIDLSFTIADSITASLQPLIQDLISNLDRLICVGSDSPEFEATDVLSKVIVMDRGINRPKVDNVLSTNLHRFFPGRS